MLEAVGFRDLRGYVAGGFAAWREAGLPLETTEAIDIEELARRLQAGEVTLLDVREDDEWEKGHVAGSIHAPYHELRDGTPEELRDTNRALAVACSAGNRSAIAVSLLRRRGVDDVVHVADGITQLRKHGIELVRGR
jgi:hydroxyacylglutathione hydrolase